MTNFWTVVNDTIDKADILLLILDSRLYEETRNAEIEDKILRTGKPFVYVLTKCDLITQEESEKIKKLVKPSVFISSTKYHGMTILRERLIVLGKRSYPSKESYLVGVLGYPNVGKSSLINAMSGRSAAGVSSKSGFTKGVQKVKADSKIIFLDTPGVIPYKEKDEEKHSVIGTIDYNKVEDPDLIVLKILKEHKGKIESYYGIDEDLDDEEKIEEIAKKRNLVRKGGIADIDRASRTILKDWQEGKII